jgi:hypothetical protein
MIMKIIKKYWFLAVLGLLSFFIFSYKLKTSTSFEGDLGRDLFEIAKISYGNFTLLGPKGSFGGIYTAPYHYYIFLLPFILSGRQLNGVLFFNVMLFSLSLFFFSYQTAKKFGNFNGFLAGLTIMLLPLFIFSARNPGNGFTPTAFFLFFLTIIYFYDLSKLNWIKILMLGFLFGMIISMLFVYITILFPVLLLIYFLLKDKKMFFIFLAGMFLSFTPLILFEFKNHFIMLKNTFIDKSYLSFVNNSNLPNGVKLNKNIFVNAIDLGKKIFPLINVNIYLILFLISSALIWLKFLKEKLFIYVTFLGYIFLIFLVRFQYSTHYLLPFLILLLFTFFIVILNSKFNKMVFIVLIFMSLILFQKNFYISAARNYGLIENRTGKIINKIILVKNDNFNVILIRSDNAPTPIGYEYRFFLLKKGLMPDSEFLYKDSSKLIVLSEDVKVDLSKFKTWEMTQFDYSKAKTIRSFLPDPNMIVYLLEK